MTHSLSAVSFRDPAGFVYEDRGFLLRQVNHQAADPYGHLMSSGLYETLTERRLLIPHRESSRPALAPELAFKVIEPERVGFLSYPYEWCFGQYQDAALATLAVQRLAVEAGMSLKDASAYNVQFHEGRPVLIDTLSLELYREGEPWVAYRQFCQHFLAPLALMSLTDVRLHQLCRTFLDGVPLDLAARLLPWRSRLRFGLSLHLHLHGMLQGRPPGRVSTNGKSGNGEGADDRSRGPFGRTALLGLIDSLESTIRGLRWRPGRSLWGSYYEHNTYTPQSLEEKRQIVGGFLDQARPASVWDLGANTGQFSRLASDRGIFTVAFDLDPACVEASYRQVREKGETRLLPLVMDLFNPSPGTGWVNRERSGLLERPGPELVMALALIHHLAFTGNLPMENIASFFRGLAPWLVIEFIAPSDSQVRTLMARRNGIHHPYDQRIFEQCFARYFDTLATRPIPGNQRILYLMRRRVQGHSAGG
jgi:hypothetical protein